MSVSGDLCMCLLVQHDKRWRHILFCFDGHRLQSGKMSCLKAWFFLGNFLSIYRYLNFNIWIIWVTEIHVAIPKEIRPLWI